MCRSPQKLHDMVNKLHTARSIHPNSITSLQRSDLGTPKHVFQLIGQCFADVLARQLNAAVRSMARKQHNLMRAAEAQRGLNQYVHCA